MTKSRKIKWNLVRNSHLICGNNGGYSILRNFAEESISGRQLYNTVKGTEIGGEIRQLLRGGVDRARQLTRKAMKYGSV